MVKLKQVKVGLLLMAFSISYSSLCNGQNIANSIMSLFIKDYAKASWTTFSGSKFGYNLNDYDTIVCNPNIYIIDTCSKRHVYVMNDELFTMFDSLKIIHPVIKFDENQDKAKPYVRLKDLKCVRHGYVLEIRIYIGENEFYAEYYFSNWAPKLLQIEDVIHLSP